MLLSNTTGSAARFGGSPGPVLAFNREQLSGVNEHNLCLRRTAKRGPVHSCPVYSVLAIPMHELR